MGCIKSIVFRQKQHKSRSRWKVTQKQDNAMWLAPFYVDKTFELT